MPVLCVKQAEGPGCRSWAWVQWYMTTLYDPGILTYEMLTKMHIVMMFHKFRRMQNSLTNVS